MPRGSTIIAIHPGALGDCILFGRLLWHLNAAVTLVAGGAKGRLLTGMGAVDRALDFDALPMHEVFSDTPLLVVDTSDIDVVSSDEDFLDLSRNILKHRGGVQFYKPLGR